MTKERLRKMQEARQDKADAVVRIEMPEGWLLQSYEYGWTITKGHKVLFYTSLRGAVESLSMQIVSRSGAKSLTAIETTIKRLYSDVSVIAERLEKVVLNA